MSGRKLSPIMKFFAVAVVLSVAALLALNIWLKKHALELYEASTRGALEKAGLELTILETSGGHLTYWQSPASDSAKPSLVLVHGSGDQAGAWSNAVPELMESYRLFIPDLPGHGESSPLEGSLDFSTVLAGLNAFLDEREAPFLFAGHSMGAWLGTLYAHQHPERIERLVLVNGGALQNEPNEVTFLPKDREQARATMAALRDPSSPPTPDVVLDAIVKRSEDGALARLMQNVPNILDHILEEEQLGEITVPVELVWGESDQVMTPKYARRLETAFPNARLTLVPKCGHLPINECPESWLRAFEEAMQQPPVQTVPEAAGEETTEGETAEGDADDPR